MFIEFVSWVRHVIPWLAILRSPIGKTIAFFSEWERRLGKYVTDGTVLMDTNLVENSIKPIILGHTSIYLRALMKVVKIQRFIYALSAPTNYMMEIR